MERNSTPYLFDLAECLTCKITIWCARFTDSKGRFPLQGSSRLTLLAPVQLHGPG